LEQEKANVENMQERTKEDLEKLEKSKNDFTTAQSNGQNIIKTVSDSQKDIEEAEMLTREISKALLDAFGIADEVLNAIKDTILIDEIEENNKCRGIERM